MPDEASTTPATTPIRVVAVDDHVMVLDSIVRLLGEEPDIEVAGTATTGADATRVVRELQPDVAVLDYLLPDVDGATVARRLMAAYPQLKVIILTGSVAEGALFDAALSGAAGYVEKTKAVGELARVIRAVRAGGVELPPDALSRLPSLDELVVHYQPIIDLTTGRIAGFEALVRRRHRDGRISPPGDFIGLAEQTNFIVAIDDVVRRTACAQLAEWGRLFPADEPRTINVNLSGRDLRAPDLTDRVAAVLDDTGLPAEQLVLEVTETFLVEHTADNSAQFRALKQLGVRLALDDFGTAYASLDYLRRMPVDIVKMDKSFTDELPSGRRVVALMRSLSRLVEDMGAISEAEGIESAGQADFLRDEGWQLGQGFYYSRAVDAVAATALLARSP